jgi:hypothetical protein
MTKPQIVLIIFSLLSCNRIPDRNDIVVFGANDKAQWITDNRELPVSDSLFYLDNPAPLLQLSIN